MKTMTLTAAIALAYDASASIYDIENPEFDVEVFRERRPVEAGENIHQTAERLADQLGSRGMVVYVRRFGTGNTYHSGHGDNGVERIEVRGWSVTGKGIRAIRGASRIGYQSGCAAPVEIGVVEALALWRSDDVEIVQADDCAIIRRVSTEPRCGYPTATGSW